MNFAERLIAGPPVLATVGRRAQVGDVVVLSLGALSYLPELTEAFEVVHARGALVGTIGLRIRSLLTGDVLDVAYREVRVLTKTEAKAARAHYADVEASR